MMSTLEVREVGGGRAWATLELRSIGGLGRLNPRLQMYFTARSASYTQVVLEDMTLRLEYHQELIGESRVTGVHVLYVQSQVTFEVVTSQRLLRHITAGVQPTATVVQFDARLSGLALVSLDQNYPTSSGFGVLATDPGPGESKRLTVSNGMPSTLQVPRAEWYERVLAQTRNEQYRYLEIALPKDDRALGAEWTSAVNHLVQAEQAYATGDDPAVFLYLRAALDSLPGAKQNILDAIGDINKRQDLDALLNKAGKFLHDGRHVAADGTQLGTFPVDHLDAAFAMDLMRVLLSHLSLMLATERHRAADLAG
ncbi:MAG: hypothetical protein ACYDH5_18870 [Acidimicrobiales bacterium]